MSIALRSEAFRYLLWSVAGFLWSCGLIVGEGEHHLRDDQRPDSSTEPGDARDAQKADEGSTADEATEPVSDNTFDAGADIDLHDERMPQTEDGAPNVETTDVETTDALDASTKDSPEETPGEAASPTCRGKCGSPNCGICPTKSMIKIHSPSDGLDSYIDATEVTSDEYQVFLAAGYDPSLQTGECTWNGSFRPASSSPAGNYPVEFVDWCDAAAYCRWANKRLCGLFGGAPTGLVNPDAEVSLTDEWYNACTGAKPGTDSRGHQHYPYGDGYRATYCNVYTDGMAQPPTLVGSLSTCQGGYAGLFDMAGNVSEWTNACDGTAGATDNCRERGGNHNDNGDYTRCDYPAALPRSSARSYVGIRCCAD
jgi:hypothetical protein